MMNLKFLSINPIFGYREKHHLVQAKNAASTTWRGRNSSVVFKPLHMIIENQVGERPPIPDTIQARGGNMWIRLHQYHVLHYLPKFDTDFLEKRFPFMTERSF